jgi:hypothetical protein
MQTPFRLCWYPQKKPATQHTPLLRLIDQQPKRTPQYCL